MALRGAGGWRGEPAYHTETQGAGSPLGRELGYMEEPALRVLLQPRGPWGGGGSPRGEAWLQLCEFVRLPPDRPQVPEQGNPQWSPPPPGSTPGSLGWP